MRPGRIAVHYEGDAPSQDQLKQVCTPASCSHHGLGLHPRARGSPLLPSPPALTLGGGPGQREGAGERARSRRQDEPRLGRGQVPKGARQRYSPTFASWCLACPRRCGSLTHTASPHGCRCRLCAPGTYIYDKYAKLPETITEVRTTDAALSQPSIHTRRSSHASLLSLLVVLRAMWCGVM